MADILTLDDIDAFLERARYTAAAAADGRLLREGLLRVLRGQEKHPARARPAARPTNLKFRGARSGG